MDALRSGTPPGRWTPQLGGRRPLDGRPQFDGCRNLIDAPRSGSISPAPLSQLSSHSITGHLAARMGQASPESPKRQRISPPPMIQRPIRPSPPSHPTLGRTPFPSMGTDHPGRRASCRLDPSLSHPAAPSVTLLRSGTDLPQVAANQRISLVTTAQWPIRPVPATSRLNGTTSSRSRRSQRVSPLPTIQRLNRPSARPHEWDRAPLGRPDTAGLHHRRRSSGRSVPFPRHRVRRAAPAPQR